MDKVQKIREEVARIQLYTQSEVLKQVLDYIDSMQEEPVSEELEDFAKRQADEFAEREYEIGSYDIAYLSKGYYWGCKAGAQWRKEKLWKPANGDDLPEIDREVIVLCKNGRVAFGHRPVEKFMARPIGYGRTEEYEVKTYDKGGWNIPDVKFWLDVDLPKEIEL